MRMLIISDIHGNLPALEKIEKIFGEFDKIIHLGDLVGYNPWPNEVIDIIRDWEIEGVMGNHDFAVVTRDISGFNPFSQFVLSWTIANIEEKNVEFLKKLPFSYKFEDMEFYHGSPRSLNEYVYPTYPAKTLYKYLDMIESKILVLGHTHIPFYRKMRGKIIMNAGSIGQPRDGNPNPSYLVIEKSKTNFRINIKRFSYNIKEVEEKMKKEGFPPFLWERLYEGI